MEIRGVLRQEQIAQIRSEVSAQPSERRTRLTRRAQRLEQTITRNAEKPPGEQIDLIYHVFELGQIYAQLGRFDLLDQMACPVLVDVVWREKSRWDRVKEFFLGG